MTLTKKCRSGFDWRKAGLWEKSRRGKVDDRREESGIRARGGDQRAEELQAG